MEFQITRVLSRMYVHRGLEVSFGKVTRQLEESRDCSALLYLGLLAHCRGCARRIQPGVRKIQMEWWLRGWGAESDQGVKKKSFLSWNILGEHF